MKEHPDPGSKDPEEDYPKFGLLDQVCEGRQEEGGEMRGGGGSLWYLSAQSRGRSLLWSTGWEPQHVLRLRVFPLTKSLQQIIWSLAGSCQYWSSLRQSETEQRRVHEWKLEWQVLYSGGVWVFGTKLHFSLLWASVQLNCLWTEFMLRTVSLCLFIERLTLCLGKVQQFLYCDQINRDAPWKLSLSLCS